MNPRGAEMMMMAKPLRTGPVTVLALTTALLLAGCSPTGFGRGAATTPSAPQPAPAVPVTTSSVQSSDLPPLGGAGASQTMTTASADPSQANDGGFVSLDQINAPTTTTASGRDLSGPVTIEKLLGGWTILAGAEQCRLNLTYTAKGATGRYRASTPACTQATLADVTSWQLLGSQIQLYNESDEIVGTLLKSGDRFVGTLAGGQPISMEG